MYWGDYEKNQIIKLSFNTVSQSGEFATVTSAGIAALDNSLLTQTSCVLSGNISSVTGLHLAVCDLSNANFVEGNDYTVFFTSGIVDNKNVKNRIVGIFSVGRYASTVDIGNEVADELTSYGALKPTVAGRTLNIESGNTISLTGVALQSNLTTLNTNFNNLSGNAVKRNINYTWTTPSGSVVTMISGGS